MVKLLTGVYQPDGGVIAIGGSEIRAIASPRAASSLGVAVVHQEAPFIDTLSVAECIAQFRGYPTQMGRIHGRDSTARFAPCSSVSISQSIRALWRRA